MKFFCICIVFFFCNIATSFKPTEGNEGIISKLREIRLVMESLKSTDANVVSQRNNVRLLISDVIVRVGASSNEFPDSYLSSLDFVLNKSKLIELKESKEQLGMLQLLFKDLNIKFKDRSNTLGVELFDAELPVSVACKRKGKTVNNMRVRYAALGYAIDPQKPDGSFATLTSPAIDKMVPGIYKIWVTEDGNYTVLREWSGEISPEKENKIELEVP